jgi:hypothetical protein
MMPRGIVVAPRPKMWADDFADIVAQRLGRPVALLMRAPDGTQYLRLMKLGPAKTLVTPGAGRRVDRLEDLRGLVDDDHLNFAIKAKHEVNLKLLAKIWTEYDWFQRAIPFKDWILPIAAQFPTPTVRIVDASAAGGLDLLPLAYAGMEGLANEPEPELSLKGMQLVAEFKRFDHGYAQWLELIRKEKRPGKLSELKEELNQWLAKQGFTLNQLEWLKAQQQRFVELRKARHDVPLRISKRGVDYSSQHLVDLADMARGVWPLFHIWMNRGNWKAHIHHKGGLVNAALVAYQMLEVGGVHTDDARNYRLIVPNTPFDPTNPPRGDLSSWKRDVIYCGNKVDMDCPLAFDDFLIMNYWLRANPSVRATIVHNTRVTPQYLEEITSNLRILVLAPKDTGAFSEDSPRVADEDIVTYEIETYKKQGPTLWNDGLADEETGHFGSVQSVKLPFFNQIHGWNERGTLEWQYANAKAA